MRILENQLKSLGAEPNSREKKSSSGSDSEVEFQSGLESKLKDTEASLQREKEQRQKFENELHELKAVAAKLNKTEVINYRAVNEITTLFEKAQVFIIPRAPHFPENVSSLSQLNLLLAWSTLALGTPCYNEHPVIMDGR